MQPYRLRLKAMGLSLLIIFCLSGAAALTEAQVNSLSGRDISTTLVRENGQSIGLGVQKTVIKRGSNIRQLLRANGVYPDADAFGLIYDLNPKLERLDPIAPGTELLLPKVQSSAPAPALPPGYLIVLTVDKRLKDELLVKLDALHNATATASHFQASRFNGPEERRIILESIDDLRQSLEVIEDVIAGKARPMSKEILNQVKADVEMLQTTLNGLAQTERPLSASDRDSIKLIAEDLSIKRQMFHVAKDPTQPPERWPEVRVIVNTLKPDDGSRVSNLTIYYVSEALFSIGGSEMPFKMPSSPAEQTLPEANYRIWAARAGDSRPVTEVKRLEVRKNSANDVVRVDLLIIN